MWFQVDRDHPAGRALADRHYSRQTPGAKDFLPPGRTLVLMTPIGDAVWGVVENLDPAGALRWRCTIFRNESSLLSSDMVRAATARTYRYWRHHYGALPDAPLTTEVDPARVRHKRDPGRCFLRAGWRVVATLASGLVRFEAPPEELPS